MLAVLYDATGANEEHAPPLFHNSGMRNTQRTFVETAAEASELFQDRDTPMKSVEVHGNILGGLASRFDKLQEVADDVGRFDGLSRRGTLRRNATDVLPEHVWLDVFVASPLIAALEVRFQTLW